MRLADMHIHTTFSPDGKSSMEEQCIKAIEIGIPIICFTDHVDFNSSEINVGRIINKASTNFDVSEYFYEVNRLRRIYNSIQILIGIEFSEPHLFPTEFEDYSSMPFDYILGSIHQSLLIPLCFLHLEKQSHSNDECFLEYNQKA